MLYVIGNLCWLGITLLMLYVIGRVVLARDYPTGVVCNWKLVLARDYPTGVVCNWKGCISSGLHYWCCM